MLETDIGDFVVPGKIETNKRGKIGGDVLEAGICDVAAKGENEVGDRCEGGDVLNTNICNPVAPCNVEGSERREIFSDVLETSIGA